jgi:TonB family protein
MTRRKYLLSFLLLTSFVVSMTVVFQTAQAAPPQLSLADILIALRSKKATLPERNQILTSAVAERGITFTLTPEIEKELQSTGADGSLIEAIRQKSTAAVAALIPPKPAPPVVTTPVPTPTPLDAVFYKKRGSSYVAKGEFDLAVVDLDKVIEMKGDDASTYLHRGIAYLAKNRPDLAIGDFNKTVELDPTNAAAYLNRGNSYEKSGNIQKAIGDYQKTLDLDSNNEAAKNSLQKLQAVQAKPEPKPVVPDNPPSAVPAAGTPEVVNVGQINNAVRLAMPVYPVMARQMNVQGKVVVQVTLDEEGKVVTVKATSGPVGLRAASEDAARKSKFNPIRVGDKVVKATGYVVFNFVSQP